MSQVTVFAGEFASQPLAFAHLLDASEAFGVALDLDHVEVILGDPNKRLAHALSHEDCDLICSKVGDAALILVFPEALIPGAKLFDATDRLRLIGRFNPIRQRAL